MPLLDELSRILNHRGLCPPLPFARLTVQYDLLVYVRSSPSTQQWIQQPDLKGAVLEGDPQATPIRRSTVLIPYLTREMICLIHSMGPMLEIEEAAQDHFYERYGHKATRDEDYIVMLQKLARTAYFELTGVMSAVKGTRFASRNLHSSLVVTIGVEQTQELVESCLRPVEAVKVKKKAKKNPFRKLFRQTR